MLKGVIGHMYLFMELLCVSIPCASQMYSVSFVHTTNHVPFRSLAIYSLSFFPLRLFPTSSHLASPNIPSLHTIFQNYSHAVYYDFNCCASTPHIVLALVRNDSL